MKSRIMLLGLLLIAFTVSVLAQIPATMSYQGILTDAAGKKVADGDYSLTFKLYDVPTGGTAIWNEVQTVNVNMGLFNVLLGSIKPLNIPFIKPYWLGVAIGSGAEMTPRMALASSPYSLSTCSVIGSKNVFPAEGGVGIGLANPSAQLHVMGRIYSGDYAKRQLSTGAWADMSSNQGGIGLFAGNAYTVYDQIKGSRYLYSNTHDKLGAIGFAVHFPWNQASIICGDTTKSTADYAFTPKIIATFTSAGKVGIGVDTPTEKLQVAGLIHSTLGGFKFPDGSIQTKAATGSGSGGIGGSGVTNYLAKFTNTVTLGNSGLFELGGSLGLGTTSPGYNINKMNQKCLTIESSTTGAIQLVNNSSLNGAVNGELMWINTHNTGDNREIATIRGVTQGTSQNKGGAIMFSTKQKDVAGLPQPRVVITDYGNLLIGTDVAKGYRLQVSGNSNPNDPSLATIGLDNYGVQYSFRIGQNKSFQIVDNTNGQVRMELSSTGNLGVGLANPATKLSVAGNISIVSPTTGLRVLELGEGLDYAEGFDVSTSEAMSPGTVLIIDPKVPGKLAKSCKAYDSRVAGIIAGSGGLKSGVRLGGDLFDHDVALAGRVYCNIDATDSAIAPGDFLTTSDTPGYAMKATDYDRARGAILGKAMERLEHGIKGQILVLVTLQ